MSSVLRKIPRANGPPRVLSREGSDDGQGTSTILIAIFGCQTPGMKASRLPSLRRIADQVLEAADLDGLVRILTRSLPAALGIRGATLLLWDRRLETFEGLAPAGGETHLHPIRPGSDRLEAP